MTNLRRGLSTHFLVKLYQKNSVITVKNLLIKEKPNTGEPKFGFNNNCDNRTRLAMEDSQSVNHLINDKHILEKS